MKPVYMTNYGKGKGNCLTACVASILECEVSDLPEFCNGNGAEWFEKLYEYCLEKDLFLAYWKHAEDVPIIALNGYIIVELKLETVEDEMHAVVGKIQLESKNYYTNGEAKWGWKTDIVHDPSKNWHPPMERVNGYVLIGKTRP